MATQYFVDETGAYLGGFDGATPPAGAIEVPTAPADARDMWVDGAWDTTARVLDDAVAAVEAKYAEKERALFASISLALLADGVSEETVKASLRAEWIEMQDAKILELIAIGGV